MVYRKEVGEGERDRKRGRGRRREVGWLVSGTHPMIDFLQAGT